MCLRAALEAGGGLVEGGTGGPVESGPREVEDGTREPVEGWSWWRADLESWRSVAG